MSWGNIEEPELEEGEAACYYGDDDDNDNKDNIDPDISLSYIGKKLENVLGHFQKEFEVGSSTEQLGAIYGGYGSFLPMYQRSAPILSRQKTPPRVQNHTNLPKENFTAPTFQPLNPSKPLKPSKPLLVNDSVKQESNQVNVKEEEKAVKDVINPEKKKKLTVRIKVGQKNAALYSGLGLTSPSSSMGNSPDLSCGTPFVSQQVLTNSPTNILQFFTSLPISGDLLLSPLHEHMLDLFTNRKELNDTKPIASVKGLVSRSEQVLKGKKSNSIEKSEKIEKIEQIKHEKVMNFVDNKEIKQHQVIPVKKREINREMFKDLGKSELLKSSSVQEFSEHQETRSNSLEKIKKIRLKNCHNNSTSCIDNVKGKGKSESEIHEGKLKTKQLWAPKVEDDVPSIKKGVSQKLSSENRVCVRVKSESEIYEGKKRVQKVEHEEKKGISVKPSFSGKKKLKRIESIDDKKSGQKNVLKVRDSYKDLFSTQEEEINGLKKGSSDTLKETKCGTHEQVKALPVLIEENWVCCDKCQKWRLLPYGTLPEHLPDKWLCSMLNWLPGMNRCDISEDETTKALHALYQIPIPETQNKGLSDQINEGKKLKLKENSQIGYNKGLKDKNYPPPQSNFVKKPCLEENFTINGDAKIKRRIKRERESDEYGEKSVKKVKLEGNVSIDKSKASLTYSKVALKDNKESERPKKPRDCLETGESSKRRKVIEDSSDGKNGKSVQKMNVKLTSPLTMEDIQELKKDLISDLPATSSSSKVSDSRRKSKEGKVKVKVKGKGDSPFHSVSSSPKKNHLLLKTKPQEDMRRVYSASPLLENNTVKNPLSDETSKKVEIETRKLKMAGNISIGLNKEETHTASSALKQAEELRDEADRLKGSGFSFECNETYFKAALMFLQGASLLEKNSESNNDVEMSQMQIYSNAANICENCASEYENCQEMALAALAYKCTEVAYMRVVYCKNTSTTRVWNDLQATLHMIPQDESPSSSASDIDNLNNQVANLDKSGVLGGKGVNSSSSLLPGNHINGPQNRPNFVRLLDFAKDVNLALQASNKTQKAYEAACNMKMELSEKKAKLSSVKKVTDLGFHDVQQLVRLVQHAML